jgi:DNA-binding MarR family transcriptional regulator/N-acetylglutamate synthase-like GNAT family acetyltransferase
MAASKDHIAGIRRFNRFYTRQLGLLSETYLASHFTLGEVRVLFELAHRGLPTASEVAQALGLDAGYLSRMLREFESHGFLSRRTSKQDARQNHLLLTAKGRRALGALEAKSDAGIRAMLGRLPANDQNRLSAAMETVQELLGERAEPKAPFVLRSHQPGDIGWVIHRHGVLYSQEYGWDEGFEALVAEIAADFIQKFDAKRERCWIAERGGEIVGSVFLVKKTARVAKLRLLLVEPSARGLGIGARLVDECVTFARQTGYRKIQLWTQSILDAARHIYQSAGFQLVRREKNKQFGEGLTSEFWELKL